MHRKIQDSNLKIKRYYRGISNCKVQIYESKQISEIIIIYLSIENLRGKNRENVKKKSAKAKSCRTLNE